MQKKCFFTIIVVILNRAQRYTKTAIHTTQDWKNGEMHRQKNPRWQTPTGIISHVPFDTLSCGINRELVLNEKFADRNAVPAQLLEHVGLTTTLSIDAASVNLVLVDEHVLNSLGTAIGQTDVVVVRTLG